MRRGVKGISLNQSRLFARPWLLDALRATGLTVLVGAALSFPFWLPARWIVGGVVTVSLGALWCGAFLLVRMQRDLRRLNAEDAARQAQWAAEDAARQAERCRRQREPD